MLKIQHIQVGGTIESSRGTLLESNQGMKRESLAALTASLVLLAFTGPVRAEQPTAAETADSPCGHCAGRPLEPVHVHLISADQTEPGWRNVEFSLSGDHLRDEWHRKACPGCKLVEYTTLAAAGFQSAIEDAARNCQQIKLMTVISHGNRGYAALGPSGHKSGLDSSLLNDTLPASLSCAIAPDATLYFDGCNVARGCRGESFLTTLAGRLLPKGGTIRACDYYSYASGILPDICPLPHSLHVDAGLKNPKWLGLVAPMKASDCKDNITRDLAELHRLLDEKDGCSRPDTRQIADWADGWLTQALASEDKLGDNRTQFTADQAAGARALELGYSDLDIAIDQLKKLKDCPATKATCGSATPPESGYLRTLKGLWNGIRQKI